MILSKGKQQNSATHLTESATASSQQQQWLANTAFAVSDRPASAQISLQIGQISSQRQYRFNINSEIGSICAREIRPDPEIRLHIYAYALGSAISDDGELIPSFG